MADQLLAWCMGGDVLVHVVATEAGPVVRVISLTGDEDPPVERFKAVPVPPPERD